jgi:hypothetical protein
MIRRPIVWIPAVVIVVMVATVGLYLFQPWKLFVDETVDEALPVVTAPVIPAASATPSSPAAGSATAAPEPSESPAPAEPVILAEGSFISHEHGTSGEAYIVELADGQRILRIENLDTDNGPDLKVWLTDAPVAEGEWYVFDDGRYVDLGGLKGNKGNANYPIPADVDITGLTSVSIWCDRFSVSFGAAELVPAV